MSARAAMPDDVVDVRWMVLDCVPEPAWPLLCARLDTAEQAKAARFRFERDRRAYVAAHALARTMLARRLGCPSQALRFAIGRHGKPEVATAAATPPLRFSLSHTHGLVAVAVAARHAVGVDAEAIDPQRLSPDLAARIFAPAEVAQLQRQAPAAATHAAFAFWTLKEAYAKSIGLGLTQPFDAVAFTLQPLAIQPAPGDGAQADRWLLRRWRPTPVHVLALAVQHPRPAAMRVDAREVDPDELDRTADGI